MRNNETGEFELVVGNRQIMSGFFIVVLLFAVGVAMGYFLGQNSPRSAKLASDAAPTASVTPVDTRPQAAAPAQTPPPMPAEAPPSAPPAEADPQPSTQPVRDPGNPAPVTATAPAAAATLAEAPAGAYWQVMAVGRSDAEMVARTLQNKGFKSLVSPGTKGLTRVLVGPYADRAALGKAKVDLEAAGFGNLVRFTSEQDKK
ncbi:MAG TPA: SPOR domain-containing protein [Candidatus Sulfopaludibacter sp.]|jgi:cell division protein FtsN|nr:SPOR domain-containing protein [Candidatus Sulfopaludibacter sp.]